MNSDPMLKFSVWSKSGGRLVCHCKKGRRCHGDVIVEAFKDAFSEVYGRDSARTVPPASAVLNFMAQLREEPPSDSGQAKASP